MNEILKHILYSKIESFVFEYQNTSREIFLNAEGKLRHPGEYGTYREEILKELLRLIIPQSLDLGTGFLITSKDHVSTQCDIVIYNSKATPMLENKERQRFFPIESVAGIVEVKSNLSKSELIEALQKLSDIKNLKNDVHPKSVSVQMSPKDSNRYDPKRNLLDQLSTYLVCNKFNFDISEEFRKDENIFDITYKDIKDSNMHNMILSIEDGLLLYYNGKEMTSYRYYKPETVFRNLFLYSQHKDNTPSENKQYKYDHIVTFLNYVFLELSLKRSMLIDTTRYLDDKETDRILVEKKKQTL